MDEMPTKTLRMVPPVPYWVRIWCHIFHRFRWMSKGSPNVPCMAGWLDGEDFEINYWCPRCRRWFRCTVARSPRRTWWGRLKW